MQEVAQLEALRQHLLMEKTQLEELQGMKDQFAEHERAQLKAMLGGMLEQQRRDRERAGAVSPRGATQGVGAGTPVREDREGSSAASSASPEPERAMDQEVNALMDILGARTFTILDDEEDTAKGRRQTGEGAGRDEPP